MNTIAKPSVQSLALGMRFSGTMLGTATGFILESPRGPALITSRHVVTGRHQDTDQPLSTTGGIPNELAVWHNDKSGLGHWIMVVEPLFSGTSPRWREHPRLGAKADFIALPLTQLEKVELYPHDVSDPDPKILVGPADSVSVIGFPFGMTGGGLFPIWATGFIATEPVADFDDLPVLLVDCRSRQGQSGSPVIAYRSGGAVALEGGGAGMYSGPVSRFIGVYSGRVNAESDLGRVWKASALAELIASL